MRKSYFLIFFSFSNTFFETEHSIILVNKFKGLIFIIIISSIISVNYIEFYDYCLICCSYSVVKS